MAIAGVDVVDSPGWWMKTLSDELAQKRKRLDLLDLYYRGTPPVALNTPKSLTSAFYKMLRAARLNVAHTIVLAAVERMGVRSIRMAGTQDGQGDDAAMAMWRGNDLDVSAVDVHNWMFRFGGSATAVGMPREGETQPVITAEDPRLTIVATDPTDDRRTVAALKLYHDSRRDMDFAYLWLNGAMHVAWRARVAPKPRTSVYSGILDGPPPPVQVRFSETTFTMAPFADEVPEGADLPALLSERYEGDPPVFNFPNRDGVGEFELHTDLLDRINHMILQRMVIATLQAYKQRAIEATEGLPKYDEDGKEIDYDELFDADPGALWRLPVGAKIWESGQVDLTGILKGASDDLQHLAAVTRTPFSMFQPTDNQSAEGAQLGREGLVFKIEDRERIASSRWLRTIAKGFEYIEDTQRSDPTKLIIDWFPAERYSLAEKSSADSLAISLPRAEKFRRIWQMTPDEVNVALAEVAAEQLQAAAMAVAAAPTPTPATEEPVKEPPTQEPPSGDGS